MFHFRLNIVNFRMLNQKHAKKIWPKTPPFVFGTNHFQNQNYQLINITQFSDDNALNFKFMPWQSIVIFVLWHGAYIRWLPRNRFVSKEQSLQFDLCKAFDQIERTHKSDIFSPNACATYSELHSNISTVGPRSLDPSYIVT